MMNIPRTEVVVAMPYPLRVSPGQRFRWEQWAPLLRDHGVDIRFLPFSTKELHDARESNQPLRASRLVLQRLPIWAREIAEARKADLVVVHRNAALTGPPLAELALSKSGVPVLYDFDDAIYLPPETHDNPIRRAIRCDWRVGAVARHASCVTVGNQTLAEYVSQFTSRVEIVPTTVHMASYPAKPERTSDVPVIGWSGSRTTAMYIEALLPILRDLRKEVRFRLLVMGGSVNLDGLEGECIPWSPETEVAGLHRMDIGLMPVPDTPWARGKCALKALQYLAVGMPAVVADVGVNSQAVRHGDHGFVVRAPEEWRKHLLELLRSADLRRKLGLAGRKSVTENYSAEAWVPRIAKILRTSARARYSNTTISFAGASSAS